jgi:hypothetical protein
MHPVPGPRREALAAVRNPADQRLGNAEDAPRAAAEIDVVANVGSGDASAFSPRQVRAYTSTSGLSERATRPPSGSTRATGISRPP